MRLASQPLRPRQASCGVKKQILTKSYAPASNVANQQKLPNVMNYVEEDLFNDSYNVMSESFEDLERQIAFENIQDAIRRRLGLIVAPKEREEEDLFNYSYNVMSQSFLDLENEIAFENQRHDALKRNDVEEDLFNDSYNVMTESFEDLEREIALENQRCVGV